MATVRELDGAGEYEPDRETRPDCKSSVPLLTKVNSIVVVPLAPDFLTMPLLVKM